MSKVKLIQSKKKLKKWLRDPKNKNNHIEKVEVIDKINIINKKLKRIAHNKRAGIVENPKSKIDSLFENPVDQYRYFSIFNKLNKKYIEYNCNFNIDDKVITSDDRIGIVKNIVVYPDKINRDGLGIYIFLYACKNDGTRSSKLLRRSKLDVNGFPIDELSFYNSDNA